MDRSEIQPVFIMVVVFTIYATILATFMSQFGIVNASFDYNAKPYIPGFQSMDNQTYFEVVGGSQAGQTIYYYNFTIGEDEAVHWNTVNDAGDFIVEFTGGDHLGQMTGFIFHQGWGWIDGRSVGYHIDNLMDYYDSEKNLITFSVSMKQTYIITIYPAVDTNIEDDLWQNYNFIMSVSILNEDFGQASTGALDMLFHIITFSIPNVNPVFGFILSGSTAVFILYFGLRVLSWFIPLTPGGG